MGGEKKKTKVILKDPAYWEKKSVRIIDWNFSRHVEMAQGPRKKKEKTKSVTVWQNLLDVTVTYFWETAKIKMKKIRFWPNLGFLLNIF